MKHIWLKTVNGRSGKELRRIPVKLISSDETWATVETEDGQRHAVLISDVKKARAKSAN